MINEGLEPVNFLNDLLETIYLIQQKKNLGDFETDLNTSESEQRYDKRISKECKYIDTYSFLAIYFKSIR